MPALYVSDLDGTLLNNEPGLSDFSGTRLQQLIGDGLKFSVASARSVWSMQPILRNLDLNLPVVELNGAFVSDLGTGRHEVVNAIDAAIAEEIFALITQRTGSPFLVTFDGTADRLYFDEIRNEGESYYVEDRRRQKDPRLSHASKLAGKLGEAVVCLTAIGSEDALADLALEVNERFEASIEAHLFENFYSPGWFWLTVHDSRATKHQGIETIRREWSLDDHDLVVFGDHLNDVSMFQRATHAVAVNNAHPTVKQHATHHIGTNEDDAVVRFIEEHYRDPEATKPGR